MENYRLKSVSRDRGWQENDLAYIPISLGNKYHYGKRLSCLLGWVAKRHTKIVINISDSLYRHNFVSEGMSGRTAYANALQKGKEWRLEHQLLFPEYNILKIHHWNDWLNHTSYLSLHQDILCLYKLDNEFKKQIDTDISNFSNRKIRYSKSNSTAIEQSKKFLLEECACYILIGRTYRANRIYPGSTPNWLLYLRSSTVSEALQGCENLKNIHIKFKRIAP
ncbi:MAG: tRNA-dependent cyclodipeptide synthase [Cyanobacteria bacterium P01_G01_bin.54]